MKLLIISASILISATLLHAASDLTLKSNSLESTVRAGFAQDTVWTVHNNGPDPATNVVVTTNVDGAGASPSCSGGCVIPEIPAGQTRAVSQRLTYPLSAGKVTLTGTVTSDGTDPNPSDNHVTATLDVSTDPDVRISMIISRDRLDLGIPFSLHVFLENLSNTSAHDLDATITFRPDTTLQSLPPDCSSPAAGRVVCRLDVLGANASSGLAQWKLDLVAPTSYGDGSIAFTATVTQREHDFDPSSNTKTATARLYQTFYVVTTADAGAGSLRQAILDANAACRGGIVCAIGFRIEEPSANRWKSIRPLSPLPALTATSTRIDGAIQTALVGDANPDGPEIEISGGGTVAGDGIHLSGCESELANVAVNGFRRNGVSITAPGCGQLPSVSVHDCFIGTDPTGSLPRPNGERGVGVAASVFAGPFFITNNVISGNLLSGVFVLAGRVSVMRNRVGVSAHSDDPLPNGASGIFIGRDCQTSTVANNVVAFNAQTGIAVAAGVLYVDLRGNSVWSNGILGIDVGLDGPSPSAPPGGVDAPAITLAHYDPALNKTVVEGDVAAPGNFSSSIVEIFANDAPDPSGYGEGQRPLKTQVLGSFTETPVRHFRFELEGDLTGQWITATDTTSYYNGFAKPSPLGAGGYLTTTSELSRAVEVR
jgi:hypothetical protein